MKISAIVGLILLASVSLAVGQTVPLSPIQTEQQQLKQQHTQKQMQGLHQPYDWQTHQFKIYKSNKSKFKCKYGVSRYNKHKCIKCKTCKDEKSKPGVVQ